MINRAFTNEATVNTFVAVDEEVYQLWLRSPSAPVGHIVHIGYNGDSAVYPNWVPYTVKLSDFPIAGHREVIKTIPSFTRQISDDLANEVAVSLGTMVFDNSDGSLDAWPRLALDGQPVRVYHGDPSWPVERFRLLYECIAQRVTGATLEEISLQLRGIEHTANVPIQTTLIPASTTTNAASNQPVPKAYGNVFNAKPAVIDDVNQVYQWNDVTGNSVSEVRDSGIPFRTNQIAISAVDAGTDTLSTATAHGFYVNTRVRCDFGTLPAAGAWNTLVWNGRLFAAVASNVVATSPDGFLWTLRTIAARNWVGMAWNGSVFVTLAEGVAICATSPDGITWTERALPSSATYTWTAIAWTGTVFCAIRTGSASAITSPDGVTWTTRTLPSSSSWEAIAWNGSVLCIVSSIDSKAATSPDGITWTARTMPSAALWRAIVWSGQVFCTIAGSTTTAADAVATSPDGITWTAAVMPSSQRWVALAWTGSVFCAVAFNSDDAATSPDGLTWTAQVLPVSTFWSAIAWNGLTLCAIASGTAYATLSSTGVSWTPIVSTLPAPLASNTDYWARPINATDFKLATTRSGLVIVNLTGTDIGAPLVGYHWAADYVTGKLYLDSRPAGELTLDGVAGSTAAATILPTVLAAINIDAASQARFALTCPQPIGIYIRERRNRLDVARDVMAGLGAWYGYNRYSLLKMGRIESSYAAHDFALIEDQMDDGSFVLERMIPPAKMHRIGYRRNWTNQAGALVDGVSTEARGLYSTDFSSSAPVLGADEGPAGQELHQLAVKPDVIESMMTYGSDALAEAVRRDGMFYGWGAIFRCTVGRIGAEMDPGHVVKVTHWRYGFAAGVRVPLVYVEDQPSNRATVLKFFAPLANYTPGQL